MLVSKQGMDSLKGLAVGKDSGLLGIKVMEADPSICKIKVQNKTHRKKRINKKWAKRYGYHYEDAVVLIDTTKLPTLFEPDFSFMEKHNKEEAGFKVRMDWGIRY